MTANEQPPDSLVGTLIDRKYRIDRCIGRGGMGSVYEATHVAIGKRVALKFLDTGVEDRDAVVRFQREAEAASAVESAHIVQIFDSGSTEDDRPYLVMELLRGEDLRSRLKRLERLPEHEVVHITVQTLRALIRAHEAGIVHRDLKPDNLFLNARDDDQLFVKVVDFGISKVAQTRATANTLTRRGTVLGTAFYMSPEQAQAFADIDGRADLYSLGAICFEALTGEAPHTGGSYEAVLVKACTQDAPDVRKLAPGVSDGLAEVVAKALARDRAERFQDAREFLDALLDACPDVTRSGPFAPSMRVQDSMPAPAQTSVTAGGTAVPTPRERQTKRRTLVTAVVASLGAFVVTVVLMARGGPSTSAEPDKLSAQLQGGQPSPSAAIAPSTTAADTAPSAPEVLPISEPAPSASAPALAKPSPKPGPQPRAFPRPKPSPGPAPAPRPGVAPDLALNPKEP